MKWSQSLVVGAILVSPLASLTGQNPFLSGAAQAGGPPVINLELAAGIETRGRWGVRLTGTDAPWVTTDLTYRLTTSFSSIRVYALAGAGFRITPGRNADPELNAGIGGRLTTLGLLGPFAEIRLRHALRTAEVVNPMTDTVAPNTLVTATIGLQVGGVRR